MKKIKSLDLKIDVHPDPGRLDPIYTGCDSVQYLQGVIELEITWVENPVILLTEGLLGLDGNEDGVLTTLEDIKNPDKEEYFRWTLEGGPLYKMASVLYDLGFSESEIEEAGNLFMIKYLGKV